MSKNITLELSETDATELERTLDEALLALRRADETHQQRQERIERLRAETHILLAQIKAELHAEETL